MNKIKLFTDFNKVAEAPHFGYVFPLVEYLLKKSYNLENFYHVTDSVEDADFIALPLSVEYLWQTQQKEYYQRFLDVAKKNHKKLLVFTSGDAGKTIHDESVITIRLGGFKNKLAKNTFIMSPFFEDPIEKYNLNFYTIDKNEKPSIGFVGHSAAGFKKVVKEFLVFTKVNFRRLLGKDATDFQSFYPSSVKRFYFLKKIESLTTIQANFIHRAKYRAGSVSENDRFKTTIEFFNNIQENPFTFCMRGAGNFSVRFYETLALGRIPVIVDTNFDLPFSKSIKWDKHCIVVKEDFSDFEDKINKFYKSIAEEDFIQLQLDNRKIWENYFTKEGYFVSLHTQLQKQFL
ncbi:exostosin domain-containing protein [Flavobacterium okayamense]|nr:exostosin family protein [Flavobacterium okayamense]